ncbi:variable surface lipoprotein [Mycoplasmopsis bovis]|nr:variable surface lipoprotein [Mycoplasmopsis bovis]QQH35051.1 variable surface lipoprotein [Mycoplasmopsis bovis]
MKKSKFLLLGSVASLASIPFVALNVVKPKRRRKKPEGDQKPGGDKTLEEIKPRWSTAR